MRSLAPDREHARTPVELAELLPDAPGLEAGLERILADLQQHFPDNLFADLDCLAANLAHVARGEAQPLNEQVTAVCSLWAQFGAASTIRFRYVHDFLYGYDWAKFVERERPPADALPFGPEFLSYMRRRGKKLEQLIAANDATYGTLTPGEHRNPFCFARDPQSEARLFEQLAEVGALPLAAWELKPNRNFGADVHAIRERCAMALELQNSS